MKARVLELLKSTNEQIRRLHQEGDQAIANKGDGETYRAKLKAKCLLLTELPGKVEETFGDQQPPDELMELVGWLEGIAEQTIQAMSAESTFPMRALLVPRGSADDDPNDLERKISSLESETQSSNPEASLDNPLIKFIETSKEKGSVRELVYYAIREAQPWGLPNDPEELKKVLTEAVDKAAGLIKE